MARKFDFISGSDGHRETLKLVVRVTDLWFVKNSDFNTHIEMILMDEKVSCCRLLLKIIYH